MYYVPLCGISFDKKTNLNRGKKQSETNNIFRSTRQDIERQENRIIDILAYDVMSYHEVALPILRKHTSSISVGEKESPPPQHFRPPSTEQFSCEFKREQYEVVSQSQTQ